MVKVSAGLLMYRSTSKGPEFFIVHPGGPFFKNKDEGAWSLPKGEIEEGEDPLSAAQREFREETGLEASAPFVTLGETRLKSGKRILAWAFQGDWDGLLMCQTHVKIEWPPRSGTFQKFPEVDKAGFFSQEQAKKKLHPAQGIFIDKLLNLI